jgi:hypothetical protein
MSEYQVLNLLRISTTHLIYFGAIDVEVKGGEGPHIAGAGDIRVCFSVHLQEQHVAVLDTQSLQEGSYLHTGATPTHHSIIPHEKLH